MFFNSKINKDLFNKYQVSGFPIILSVAQNSPSFKAGFKKNDIILEINNLNTENFRKKLFLNYKNKEQLVLKILREKNYYPKNKGYTNLFL